jgi:hypothetical protein
MSQKKLNASHSKAPDPARPATKSSSERSLHNQNVRGVHAMREGNIDEAVSILRSLVMPPGCTWTRPDAPNMFKRNFATVLLLAGHPSGCLELLAEMRDEQHPRVQELRAAIKRWEKTLSFFQWLNWRTGWIEPANRPVTLDFVPGEIEGELPRPGTTQNSSTSLPLTTAM